MSDAIICRKPSTIYVFDKYEIVNIPTNITTTTYVWNRYTLNNTWELTHSTMNVGNSSALARSSFFGSNEGGSHITISADNAIRMRDDGSIYVIGRTRYLQYNNKITTYLSTNLGGSMTLYSMIGSWSYSNIWVNNRWVGFLITNGSTPVRLYTGNGNPNSIATITYYSSFINSSRGSYVGTSNSSRSGTYPNNGISGSYWYTFRNRVTDTTTVWNNTRGDFIEQVRLVNMEGYPTNGIYGGYWYTLNREAKGGFRQMLSY